MEFMSNATDTIYERVINENTMTVNFDEQRLDYGRVTVNREDTCNFRAMENFVVFECVCRLLERGYRAEHIELEPVWTMGHNEASGRADILVRDADGRAYILIECKTAGREYKNEHKNTDDDGGQLFSYWQQEGSVRWLMLYASDWADNTLTYKADVIRVEDDENIKKLAESDPNIQTYERARSVVERYEAWANTYEKEWLGDIVFKNSVAYHVGIPPLKKCDLKSFETNNGIVNKFEEILRHNNVSDKENAFNRLIALFICKLVDEIKKTDEDEVEFQYKRGTDTYESLQDRLQHLHQVGMDEFMKEKIIYIPDEYAENLFQQYTGQRRKEAIENLRKTIRVLKFYSNNDFAFKDVHNEELFYQNGKILVEVVQLFQNYRIVYPANDSTQRQLLGDLFEQLLNKGFKQNEGQFFTPTPITRFIWDSLPLRDYISNHRLPRIIDYACGAGHFLTEGIEAINAVRGDTNTDWVKKNVVGVEKDYRLARVSKVAMHMNGEV